MDEGIAVVYLDKLKNADNPGVILAKFYCELFNIKLTPQIISMFNKFNKVYGRNIVYATVLDLTDVADLTFDRIYGLISHICKKKLDISTSGIYKPLDKLVEENKRKVNRIKEMLNKKPRSPFDDWKFI